jgi:hypothetical protein
VGEHVVAQGGVDAALIAAAGTFKEGEDVGVEAKGDLLLVFFGDEVRDRAPAGFVAPVRDIAEVDVFIAKVAQGLKLLRRHLSADCPEILIFRRDCPLRKLSWPRREVMGTTPAVISGRGVSGARPMLCG